MVSWAQNSADWEDKLMLGSRKSKHSWSGIIEGVSYVSGRMAVRDQDSLKMRL